MLSTALCNNFIHNDFLKGGEPTSRPCANNGKYLQYQKKIICYQIRKSATSPVLQGGFQCHKKQIARVNVNDLK